MKICDLVQFYSPLSGGVKRYIHDKAHYLGSRTDVEHVLVVPGERDRTGRLGETVLHEVRSPRLPGSASYRLLVNRSRILGIMQEERPDLIEVGDPYLTAWTGLRAARQLGIPIVSYYHSDYPRGFRRTVDRYFGPNPAQVFTRCVEQYLAALYRRMDAVVVATAKYERLLASLGLNNLVRIPLGADLTAFRPQGSREQVFARLGIPKEARLLIFAGRLAREKNIRSLVAMLDVLNSRSESADYHFLLIGGGELESWIASEARRRPNLHHLPYLNEPRKLAEYLSAADRLVHAGMHETFGLSVLEAQACGIPATVVRDSGLEDVIALDEASGVAESTRPEDLAAAVLRHGGAGGWEEREARHRLARGHFSCEQTFSGMEKLYRHLHTRTPLANFAIEGRVADCRDSASAAFSMPGR